MHATVVRLTPRGVWKLVQVNDLLAVVSAGASLNVDSHVALAVGDVVSSVLEADATT